MTVPPDLKMILQVYTMQVQQYAHAIAWLKIMLLYALLAWVLKYKKKTQGVGVIKCKSPLEVGVLKCKSPCRDWMLKYETPRGTGTKM